MAVILETPRLVLREVVPEDVDALALVLSDPETIRYYPAPYGRGRRAMELRATKLAVPKMGSAFGR